MWNLGNSSPDCYNTQNSRAVGADAIRTSGERQTQKVYPEANELLPPGDGCTGVAHATKNVTGGGGTVKVKLFYKSLGAAKREVILFYKSLGAEGRKMTVFRDFQATARLITACGRLAGVTAG